MHELQRYAVEVELPFVGYVRGALTSDLRQAVSLGMAWERYFSVRTRLVDRWLRVVLFETPKRRRIWW